MTIIILYRQIDVYKNKMRDFTSNEYCDYLWINDLLSLEKKYNNEFKAVLRRSGREKSVSLLNVTIFGTIVEIKRIGDRGILYSVDDGTGIIACKYNEILYGEAFDVIQTEQAMILNETFSNQSMNESKFDFSVSEDDTIFNDLSLQEEEAAAIKRNRLKTLHSIWADIEESFSGMIGVLSIGDSVVIQGKLYNYFNTNQIHVNSIRLMDTKEELILTSVKFQDGYEPCVKSQVKDPLPPHTQLMENSRRSGVMTFDHIHHLDVNEMNSSKIVVGRENEDENYENKRNSIVLPNLQSFMTFDTFTNLNDSGPSPKIPRIERI